MDDATPPLSNEPIDVAGLPRLRPEPYVSVDPRHALGSIATLAVLAVAAVLVGLLIASRSGVAVWNGIGFAVAAVLLASAGWAWAHARRIAYQVRDHDVSLRAGIISISEESVPFRRVQHVQLSRGLLDRSLGLASLSINSAGPDIQIPGLPLETATALRTWMVERAGLDAEGAEADELPPPAPLPPPPPPGAPAP